MKIDHTQLFGGNFDAMSPADIGVSFMIAKYIFDSKKESISMDLARKIVDRGHQHGFNPAKSIAFLVEIGIFEEVLINNEPAIGFPALNKVIERENKKHMARVIGWDSRRNADLAVKIKTKARGKGRGAAAPEAEPEDVSPVVCEILCKNNKVVKITEKWIEEKSPLYSGVDIRRELLLAAEWCRVNPVKRKTESGVGKFLMNWLNSARTREQTQRHILNTPSKAGAGFGTGGRKIEPVAGSAPPAGSNAAAGDGVDLLTSLLGESGTGKSETGAGKSEAGGQVAAARKPAVPSVRKPLFQRT